MDFIKQPTQD
jgi:hypothetical protein